MKLALILCTAMLGCGGHAMNTDSVIADVCEAAPEGLREVWRMQQHKTIRHFGEISNSALFGQACFNQGEGWFSVTPEITSADECYEDTEEMTMYTDDSCGIPLFQESTN